MLVPWRTRQKSAGAICQLSSRCLWGVMKEEDRVRREKHRIENSRTMSLVRSVALARAHSEGVALRGQSRGAEVG